MNKRRSKVQRRKKAGVLLAFFLLLLAVAWFGIRQQIREKVSRLDTGKNQETSEAGILYQGRRYVYNDHLSNYLFLGIDSRAEVDTYENQNDAGQADAIFLVSLDRKKNTLQVLTIPRDTMTQVVSYNPSGRKIGSGEEHINIQYAYGDGKHKSCELMKKTVSELLHDLPIENYCSINMDGIPLMTKLVGSVEVTVPDDALEEVNPEFKKGTTVTLTQENAEQFLRTRDTSENQSAFRRMARHKAFLQAYVAKIQEIAAKDAGIVTDLYEGLKPYMVTGMGTDHFARLLEASMKETPVTETLPGEGAEGKNFDEYHVNEEELSDLLIRMFYKEA